MKFLFLLCGLSLFINSCAQKKDLALPEREKDLVESFDMNDEELQKFKTLTTPQVSIEEKKESPAPVEIKKPSKKKKVEQAPVVTKALVPEVEEEKAPPAQEEDLYPEAFKQYDKKSEKFWLSFKPKVFVGEKFVFEVSYVGVKAGTVTIQTQPPVLINDKKHYHFMAEMISADYYSYIYALKDRIESFVEEEKFLPVKYFLIQRESGQNVDDLQIFDHEKNMTTHWYKREKKNKDKKEKKEAVIPKYFQDSFSALYFIRGFPLKKGDIYQFPIVTRAKIWLLKVRVMGEEEIEVMDKKIKAIKLEAETQFPGVLKKSGDINFWYSADSARKLLMFKAKVKIGTVEGNLIEYVEGK
ncbi:MAG: hypothetical protein Fur0010_10680 [Bdellovibrio sp.]